MYICDLTMEMTILPEVEESLQSWKKKKKTKKKDKNEQEELEEKE